jgi:hypothetical protein
LAQDPWHFARSEQAKKILQTLEIGLISAIAIIEPRRKGKTTFLLEDIRPAVEAQGMLAVYINLAAATGDLETFIAATLRAGVESAAGLLGSLRAAGRTRVKKVAGKASLASAGISAEVELDNAQGRGALPKAFEDADRLGRRVVLLLDEVHKLGEPSGYAVAWSLRSLLDVRRGSVKVVATSSSAASYELLVSGEKRAFNRWFTRTDLEPLGLDFVAHLAKVAAAHFPRHAIRVDELRAAFDVLGRSPKFLRDYLNTRLLNPGKGHARALEEASLEATRESGYEDAFVRLVPLQKIVLLAVASGQTEFFSHDALSAAGKVLTGEPVSKTLMQRALRSLAMQGWVIRRGRGDYALADALFERWLQDQLRAGTLPAPTLAS